MSKPAIVGVPAKGAQPRLEQFTERHFLEDNTLLAVRGWAFKNLEGRLLTLVESMGLPEKQEEAVKGYMRREVWATVYEGYKVSDEAKGFLEESFSMYQPTMLKKS